MNTRLRRPDLQALFSETDAFTAPRGKEQPPRIGISANRKEGLSCIAETYVRSVLDAGGAPVLIPVMTDLAALSAIVDGLDGLLLSGGGDLNPLYVGEEPIRALQEADTLRDEYDLLLLRLAAGRQLPLMGICRGHQLMNAAFGGRLYQDIYSESDQTLLKHSQAMPREQVSHTVRIAEGSRLREWLDADTLGVNSFHHQAVRETAPGWTATAVAPDGINEGTEHPERPWFSVQWHPEALAAEGDETMLRLFDRLITEARLFRQAKALHERIITVDSHTDTPMIFPGRFDIGRKEGGKVNLPFMEEGRIDATFMVAYIPQGKRDDASLAAATAYAVERLTEVRRQETFLSARMGIATSAEEIRALKQAGRKAICLGIENGYAIGKNLDNLAMFNRMGVLYLTLCHNGDNDLCDSARGRQEWGGLSPLGKEAVREMNRLGMMVDVSHAAESTFYDVLEVSREPVIASHSSARALCNHPRNLSDDQLRALAAAGGVCQLCLYKGFIREEDDKAALSDAIRHIDHLVEVAGIDHVGIGSDFDGDGELIGCRATNELIRITVKLLEKGYTENDIQKIWGGNLLRVLSAVQAAARN